MIDILCNREEGKKETYTSEHYQVSKIFDKHYNKWHICEENQKPRHTYSKKGNVLVLYMMVEKYDFFGTHKDVMPRKIQDWSIK